MTDLQKIHNGCAVCHAQFGSLKAFDGEACVIGFPPDFWLVRRGLWRQPFQTLPVV